MRKEHHFTNEKIIFMSYVENNLNFERNLTDLICLVFKNLLLLSGK
jgi:hypothetical protein